MLQKSGSSTRHQQQLRWRGCVARAVRSTGAETLISTTMPRRSTRTSCARSVSSPSSVPQTSSAATPSVYPASTNTSKSRSSALSTASPRTSKNLFPRVSSLKSKCCQYFGDFQKLCNFTEEDVQDHHAIFQCSIIMMMIMNH